MNGTQGDTGATGNKGATGSTGITGSTGQAGKPFRIFVLYPTPFRTWVRLKLHILSILVCNCAPTLSI